MYRGTVIAWRGWNLSNHRSCAPQAFTHDEQWANGRVALGPVATCRVRVEANLTALYSGRWYVKTRVEEMRREDIEMK